MAAKRIRIKSDGTPHGTKVTCGDVEVADILSVKFDMDWENNGGPRATVVVLVDEADLVVRNPTISGRMPGQ